MGGLDPPIPNKPEKGPYKIGLINHTVLIDVMFSFHYNILFI